ncbi:hypothetical protein QC764_0081520 [Podospora pseudoanserina]|uniref:Hydrophobin n=1 Tax=Podospora pseudoanserina TaxID=2609844 RepID=A0ABR0I6J2_9PEZI|nr:hypothetical protein QC764_0081520 [Podospora pseudoanserina]
MSAMTGVTTSSQTRYPDCESNDYAYPFKPMCGAPGSPCTIDNFVDVCCTNVNGSVGCSFPSGDPQFGTCFLSRVGDVVSCPFVFIGGAGIIRAVSRDALEVIDALSDVGGIGITNTSIPTLEQLWKLVRMWPGAM